MKKSVLMKMSLSKKDTKSAIEATLEGIKYNGPMDSDHCLKF